MAAGMTQRRRLAGVLQPYCSVVSSGYVNQPSHLAESINQATWSSHLAKRLCRVTRCVTQWRYLATLFCYKHAGSAIFLDLVPVKNLTIHGNIYAVRQGLGYAQSHAQIEQGIGIGDFVRDHGPGEDDGFG